MDGGKVPKMLVTIVTNLFSLQAPKILGQMPNTSNVEYFMLIADPIFYIFYYMFRCLQQGAHLSSVHTRSENEFIMVWLQRQGINTGFLGLYRDNDEQFVWSDGTPSDYFNWENGGVYLSYY